MNEFDEKVIIVTGAGNGIGKGIAKLMAQQGAKVIIATKEDSEGFEVEQSLITEGLWAKYIQTDVSDELSIQNMLRITDIEAGGVDVLVNNAGVTVFKPLIETTLADWEMVIGTDLKGVFLCSKYAAKSMIAHKKRGCIINISSNHAYRTLPDTELYAAAKGGVNAMTRSMAISLGQYGIRVNSICPGFTDTHHYQTWLATKKDPEIIEQEILELHALGCISTPVDVAEMVSFLASERSRNVTGSDFLIDGGLTSRLYFSQKF